MAGSKAAAAFGCSMHYEQPGSTTKAASKCCCCCYCAILVPYELRCYTKHCSCSCCCSCCLPATVCLRLMLLLPFMKR